MILVVGATGQLGTAVVRRLRDAGRPVRAFVRRRSAHQHLKDPGIERCFGDLRDEASVDAACRGVETVIATANTVVPRDRYSFEAIEGGGYEHLIAACERHGVGQFVFMSVATTPVDRKVPTYRYKRRAEQRLIGSDVPYTIFRTSPFIDDWVALMGSTIPLRDAEAATLARPFWFLSAFIRGVDGLIDRHGLALVPGSGATRHAFVALDDVADILVAAIGHPAALNAVHELGGPDILSWDEAVGVFADMLGRKVRSVHIPAAVYRIQQLALRPVSPAASNLMGLSWINAQFDTAYDMTETRRIFDVDLTSLAEFLERRVRSSDRRL